MDAQMDDKLAGISGSNLYSACHAFPAHPRALCWAHLKPDFTALSDLAGERGHWGARGRRKSSSGGLRFGFQTGEFDREELPQRLAPLKARLELRLRRGGECPDQKVAGLYREINKWWEAL